MFLRKLGLFSEQFLLLVVLNQAEVAFADQDLAFLLDPLLALFFRDPLGL